MPREATKEPLGARLLRALSAAFAVLLLLALILVAPRGATAAATVTPATGGTNLTVGTFAPLNGPSVQGGASGDIGLGDIVLQAPAGFEFDPSRSVTARVTDVAGTNCNASKSLLLNGASSQTVVPTAKQVKITVTRRTSGGCRASIAWSGIHVKATAPGSGNITKAPGGSPIVGVTDGATSFAALSTTPTISLTLDTGVVGFGTGLGPDGSPSSLASVAAYPDGDAGAFYVRGGAASEHAVSVTVKSTAPYSGSVSAAESAGTAGMKVADNSMRWTLGDMNGLAEAKGGRAFTSTPDATVFDRASDCASGQPKQQGECRFRFDYGLRILWTDAPGDFVSVVTYTAQQ